MKGAIEVGIATEAPMTVVGAMLSTSMGALQRAQRRQRATVGMVATAT
jgi:hypothetical protein